MSKPIIINDVKDLENIKVALLCLIKKRFEEFSTHVFRGDSKSFFSSYIKPLLDLYESIYCDKLI